MLYVEEMALPAPKANEVLIKVNALSLNPAEWHILRGSIWLIRLGHGLLAPRRKTLGGDVAGVVVAVGHKVQGLAIGQRVFGRAQRCCQGEYACLAASRAALIPDGVSFKQAAALPLAAMTAQETLQQHGPLKQGTRVLINGASGGIGTMAVQLARQAGAIVHGVCSSHNSPMVQRLGAHRVFHYDQDGLSHINEAYDLVIDLVGNWTARQIKRWLNTSGKSIMVGFSNFKHMLGYMFWGMLFNKRRRQFATLNAQTTRQGLEKVASLTAERRLEPVIDRTYPFALLPEAYQYLGTRRAKGKVVVTLHNAD